MTDDEMWSALEAIHAYETGATDSGIRDEVLRQRCAERLDSMAENDVRWSLSRWVRDAYLSDKAIAQGYGWEDALEFLTWIESGAYRR